MSTTQTAAAGGVDRAGGGRAAAPSKWNMLRYAAVFCGVLAGGGLAVAGLNRHFDPLNHGGPGRADLVRSLVQGHNVALRDPNLDFRGHRRDHLRAMAATPDVIAFAGSRFELATKGLFPGRTFYNGFVHNDYFEDLLAFTELLRANGRLPRTLILSVRFVSFLPPGLRETEEWKLFWPEYRAMADRLGIEPVPLAQNLPWRHWAQLLSLDALRRQIASRLERGQPVPRPTPADRLPDLDVLHVDGSLAFSDGHQGTFTAESSRRDAASRGEKAAARKEWPVDWGRVAALGKLLDYLRSQGVQTAVAITPHHPAYWAAVADAPYGRTLQAIERRVGEIAAAHGAVLAGGFDPARAGCRESSFRDYIHMDEACLKAVFDQVPLPPRPE